MKVSIKILKEFNTMLFLQLQVPSKEHHRVNYITNYVLNLLNLDVGFGNYVVFTKSKQLDYQNTCLILFRKPMKYARLVKSDNVTTFYSRTDVYKYSLFTYIILEWNKLDENIQQSKL